MTTEETLAAAIDGTKHKEAALAAIIRAAVAAGHEAGYREATEEAQRRLARVMKRAALVETALMASLFLAWVYWGAT